MKKSLMSISAAAIVALTAGCGTGDDAGTGMNHETTTASAAASAEHNDADITFAQMMIPHHQQAVDMADMAAEKATDARVKTLASKIQGAQAPEIEQLTTMLETWGTKVEATDMPGMNHGSMGDGMMTDDQMTQLEQSTGADFDTMWLQMMIEHHEGAVTMAKTELAQGKNPDAKTLAQKIIDAQETEITEMQGMLA